MVFSSVIFLFAFLPATLLVYALAHQSHRNFVLLVASLAFYYWGEAGFVLLMVGSALVNYGFGILIHRTNTPTARRWAVVIAVVVNLLPLLFFKYTVFIFEAARDISGFAALPEMLSSGIHLPIGISFFTFQAISYVVDVYRRHVQVQRNILNLALYIALFPQLIAGPIVRYNQIERQITERTTRLNDLREGVQRFIIGLGKKVLIANVMGEFADHVFNTPVSQLSSPIAILGILAYSLQIYYDFSGYSDMAIGLGRMFGFRFPENFNYPYISRSVTEFWRRWHISLSSWFRDYLYIPLGGNRQGAWRTYFNLLIVFVLCGLWHGAQWTFLIWGLVHGLFLVVERAGLAPALEKLPRFVGYTYTLVVVVIAWVFFRANDLHHAFGYFASMVNVDRSIFLDAAVVARLTPEFWVTMVIGIVFSMPVWPWLNGVLASRWSQTRGYVALRVVRESLVLLSLAAIAVYAIAGLMSADYNPFLYFRF